MNPEESLKPSRSFGTLQDSNNVLDTSGPNRSLYRAFFFDTFKCSSSPFGDCEDELAPALVTAAVVAPDPDPEVEVSWLTSAAALADPAALAVVCET